MRASVAVLDQGKTNVKLSACTDAGQVVETIARPNPVLPGPPWRHHDMAALNHFVLEGLADLARRHPLTDFVAAGHGSATLFAGLDVDAGGTGLVLPMIDYDQPLPEGLADAYAPLAGGFADRGSAMMMAATHMARQMFWAETAEPAAFVRVAHVLGIPQYWGWRLSGVAASEVSILGAQSHLWNVAAGRFAPVVAARGWGRLLPPLKPAAAVLGPLRADLRARHGLPDLRVHVGAHDSSVAFFRHQAAGRRGIAVISTGTWIVGLADGVDLATLDETRGMTLNADLTGRPLGGALCMGGRDYAAIAGDQPDDARAQPATLARLIARGTMALPAFGPDGGQFPHRAGLGTVLGPPCTGPEERHALGVLHVALLALACGMALAPDRDWVLDGSFLRDPAFAGLLAALRPGQKVMTDSESHGIAAGAALLCRLPGLPPEMAELTAAVPLRVPGLQDYAALWLVRAGGTR